MNAVYPARSTQLHERLDRAGIDVRFDDIDFAIFMVVGDVHDETGMWPSPDNDRTWDLELEDRVLNHLGIDYDHAHPEVG